MLAKNPIARLRAANQKVFAAETVAALKTRVDLEATRPKLGGFGYSNRNWLVVFLEHDWPIFPNLLGIYNHPN